MTSPVQASIDLILNAEAVVLLRLTHALRRVPSLCCSCSSPDVCVWVCAGNLAWATCIACTRSTWREIYKTVKPHGLDPYATPACAHHLSKGHYHAQSIPGEGQDRTMLPFERTVRLFMYIFNLSTNSSPSIMSSLSVSSITSTQTTKSHLPPLATPTKSFFGNRGPRAESTSQTQSQQHGHWGRKDQSGRHAGRGREDDGRKCTDEFEGLLRKVDEVGDDVDDVVISTF